MENNNVIKNEKFYKSGWVNMIFITFGLMFIVDGIQRIIDNHINFTHWFWFIFGVIVFFTGILFSILDCIKSMKNKKKRECKIICLD